jgi:hypothetical protein
MSASLKAALCTGHQISQLMRPVVRNFQRTVAIVGRRLVYVWPRICQRWEMKILNPFQKLCDDSWDALVDRAYF